MTVRKILLYPQDEAALRRKSLAVKRLDAEVKALIADLKDTLATQAGAGWLRRKSACSSGSCWCASGRIEANRAAAGADQPDHCRSWAARQGLRRLPEHAGAGDLGYTAPDLADSSVRGTKTGRRSSCASKASTRLSSTMKIDHLNGVLFLDRMDKGGKLYVAADR